jgi:hypothetical protein
MAMKSVHRFGVAELSFESARDYGNPNLDCSLVADFSGPGGRIAAVRGFWDGGRAWRVRFSPDAAGTWTWRTRCPSGQDDGLERSGALDCVAYEGENPLYAHGPLRLSDDRRRMVHADGAPFFWLADTAWNGVIRGGDDDWRRYLDTRARQRFTAVQFVATHWRGDERDELGERASTDEHPIRINPSWFQRLDRRVAMINEAGIVGAPVALWTLLRTDPGWKLHEEDATRLAFYVVARYGAYQLLWLLGGDGPYQEIGVDRWKRIGRAVFGDRHDRLVTLHPCGLNWVGEEFRGEKWYDVIGYQSGHGDADGDLRWLVSGPPAGEWDHESALPVVNLEPNYESARGYQHKTTFTDYHVRRAAYWSLLVSPAAGVTYGHDTIWNWNAQTGPSEGHPDLQGGAVPPWHAALDTPGVRSMTVLRGIFDRLDWPTLTPCRTLLARQPGDDDVKRFVAAARSADGTAVIYAPCGGALSLAPNAGLSGPLHIVDPRTGKWSTASEKPEKTVSLPDDQDWLVVCGGGWKA